MKNRTLLLLYYFICNIEYLLHAITVLLHSIAHKLQCFLLGKYLLDLENQNMKTFILVKICFFKVYIIKIINCHLKIGNF